MKTTIELLCTWFAPSTMMRKDFADYIDLHTNCTMLTNLYAAGEPGAPYREWQWRAKLFEVPTKHWLEFNALREDYKGDPSKAKSTQETAAQLDKALARFEPPQYGTLGQIELIEPGDLDDPEPTEQNPIIRLTTGGDPAPNQAALPEPERKPMQPAKRRRAPKAAPIGWQADRKPQGTPTSPKQFKLQVLRECPPYDAAFLCDTPELASQYWTNAVSTAPEFEASKECFTVLMLNTRRRVIGHHCVSVGGLDTVFTHPREVFQAAMLAGASAIILMHNHPSGDPTPSEADIKVTRDLIVAGQLLKIDVLDHVIVGQRSQAPHHVSLREAGFFFT